MGAMAIEVEEVSPTRRAVADVRDPLDTIAPEDRREQDAAKGRSTAEPRGALGAHDIAPAVPEALAQGLLDCRACPSRPQAEDHKSDRRQEGQAEPEPENR